jgi:hypothetical protein
MSASFAVELAKTGRAACKDSACKKIIDKGTLRIAKNTPSPFDADEVRMNPRCRAGAWWGVTCWL